MGPASTTMVAAAAANPPAINVRRTCAERLRLGGQSQHWGQRSEQRDKAEQQHAQLIGQQIGAEHFTQSRQLQQCRSTDEKRRQQRVGDERRDAGSGR